MSGNLKKELDKKKRKAEKELAGLENQHIQQLKQRLKEKADLNVLVSEVLQKPSLLADLVSIITREKSSIKFSCTKIIRLVSEQAPSLVYPYFNEISNLLTSGNSFIKWDGIIILSNLASVDTENKFDSIYQTYFDLIQDSQMITAANVVGNAWKIIQSKPQYEADITKRMLAVPDITYYNKDEPSPECNNVLCGHVIDCFEKYYPLSGSKREIISFVKRQRNNSRKPVAKKAEKFLKKYLEEAI